MFSSAKAEVITGIVTNTMITGFSFSHDVMPLISEVGVCAGTLLALHGLGKIIYHYIKGYHQQHIDLPPVDLDDHHKDHHS